MNKKYLTLILLLFLINLVSASKIIWTGSMLTGNYIIESQTGIDYYYEVNFEKINDTGDVKMEYCLTEDKLKEAKKNITNDYGDIIESEYKDYKVPKKIKVDKKFIEINVNSEIDVVSKLNNGKNKDCIEFIENPYLTDYIKIGENSTFIVSEYITFAEAILTNITLEQNFTHLSIDTSQEPYNYLVAYYSLDDYINNKIFDYTDNNINGVTGTSITDNKINLTKGIYENSLLFSGNLVTLNQMNGIENLSFGMNATYQKIAQNFSKPANTKVNKIYYYRYTTNGTPPGYVTMGIQSDSSGNPSGTWLTKNEIGRTSNWNLAPVKQDIYLIIDIYNLTSGNYWIVITSNASLNNTDFYNVAYNSTNNYNTLKIYNGTNWNIISGTLRFGLGTSDGITLDSDIILTHNNFSVSWWAKRNTSNYDNIFSRSGVKTISGQIEFYSSSAIRYESYTNNVDDGFQFLTGISNSDNIWHHYVLMSNSTNSSLFVDGIERSIKRNFTDTANQVYRNIGGLQGNGNWNLYGDAFNGSLDEIMFFNISLNSSQISDIYNNQSSRFKNLGTQTIKQFNITSGFDKINITLNNYSRFLGSNISVRIGQWDVSLGYNNTDLNSSANGLIGYWNFDEESWNGTTGEVKDAMGRNNGTSQNATGRANTTASGVYSRAGNFNGVTNAVAVSSAMFVNGSNASVSLWVNAKTNATSCAQGSQYIISQAMNGINNNRCYSLTYQYSSRSIGYAFSNSVGSAGTYVYNLTDRWTHIVYLWNSTNGSIYINGNNVQTGAFPYCAQPISSNFYIGAGIQKGCYFNGTIDEVMIFNRSLTADEAKELYVKGRTLWNYSSYQNLTGNSNDNSSTNTFTISTLTTNILTDFMLLTSPFNFYSPNLRAINGLTSNYYDTQTPSLTINYPTNGSSYGFNGPINLTLNITANDTNGISIMWYNVDNGNNVTFTNITGISLSVLEGTTNSYTINVYVNDTYNNINATTLSISVSQLNPPGMGGVVRSYIKPQNMTKESNITTNITQQISLSPKEKCSDYNNLLKTGCLLWPEYPKGGLILTAIFIVLISLLSTRYLVKNKKEEKEKKANI